MEKCICIFFHSMSRDDSIRSFTIPKKQKKQPILKIVQILRIYCTRGSDVLYILVMVPSANLHQLGYVIGCYNYIDS